MDFIYFSTKTCTYLEDLEDTIASKWTFQLELNFELNFLFIWLNSFRKLKLEFCNYNVYL